MRRRSPRQVPGIRPSLAREFEYRAALRPIVEHLDGAGTALAEAVRGEWSRASDAGIVAADGRPASAGRFEEQVRRAAAAFGDVGATARRLAWAAAQREFEDVDDRLAKTLLHSVSVDIKPLLTHDRDTAAAMGRAVSANVDLIQSIPQQYFAELRNLLAVSFHDGVRWEGLVDRIHALGHTTLSRSRLIARDQVGKMNADFNRVRQTSIGIAEYRWRGVEDVRERTSHRAMEGRRIRWNAPPLVDGERVHAGEAIQCRCWGDPLVFVDEIGEPERWAA